ncbi:MAG: HAD family hydrolase [Sorangiineae bacterium]|nr:HAD family hydrolase [Polyangiaceae bacterium]MEB2321891.1 HAD family hydrolase [Sorangiineae bacterium]
MSELGERQSSPTPAGPLARPVSCATCGALVDPLRAARVAIFRERFRYFCSVECRDGYHPDATGTPLPRPPRRRGKEALAPDQVISVRRTPDPAELDARRHAAEALAGVASDDFDALEPLIDTTAAPPQEVVAETDLDTLLLAIASLAGALAVALALAGDSGVALSARVVVAVVGAGALVTEQLLGRRDPTEPHPMVLLAAPIASALVALLARVTDASHAPSAITLAGVVIGSVAAGVWATRRARRVFDAEREAILRAVERPVHRIIADELSEARVADLRPGEEIVVEAGEVVPVDATVLAGSAEVLPWLGATVSASRGEGDTVVAGATILDGRLRLVVGWAGHDRAWLRLTVDPRRRADLYAPLARAGRLTAERIAPMAAGIAALAAFAGDQSVLSITMVAIATQASLASSGIAQIGALHIARTVLASLRRGIAIRSAELIERLGQASVAAFCARGTLLLGEPEVANIDPIGPNEPEKVLAFVAGAESGATHPVAAAVLRAARARGVRPDGVRSPSVQPGLGVTAVASSGQPLVVGSRALMLRERISVAAAESRITELEAMGRTVLLVALGSRLIGVLGLQDGLRPGARAAVQHLLDVEVEPVLVSGDARETCEALGRALDIEHIRPELLPTERGDEIRRLVDGGATVAVIGRSPADDAALAAADVAVALGSAGSSSAEWSVELASDDVRDAAYSIRLAHECRREGRFGLVLATAPAVAGAVAVAFALAPAPVAPLAALAGATLALLRLRSRGD